MKSKESKIILAIVSATLIGFVFYAAQRRKQTHRLARVSDEGYETAHDVLFPHPGNRRRRNYYGQEYTL